MVEESLEELKERVEKHVANMDEQFPPEVVLKNFQQVKCAFCERTCWRSYGGSILSDVQFMKTYTWHRAGWCEHCSLVVCGICSFLEGQKRDRKADVCPKCGTSIETENGVPQEPLIKSAKFSDATGTSSKKADWSTIIVCDDCGAGNPVNATECIRCRGKRFLVERHGPVESRISQKDLEEVMVRISKTDDLFLLRTTAAPAVFEEFIIAIVFILPVVFALAYSVWRDFSTFLVFLQSVGGAIMILAFILFIPSTYITIRERGFSRYRWRDFFCNAKHRRILLGFAPNYLKVDAAHMLIGTSSRSDVRALKRVLKKSQPNVVFAIRRALESVQGVVAKKEAGTRKQDK